MSDHQANPAATWAMLLRVSLRELLVIVAFLAIAIVALKFASPFWRTIVYTIAMVVFLPTCVVAIIHRGQRQAAAIGFVVFAGVYVLLVANARGFVPGENLELNPYRGHLPTTRIAYFFYDPVTTTHYFDAKNQRLKNYDPANPPPGVQITSSMTSTTPDAGTYMRICHCIWALLLGFVGARFAQFVYWRRMNESK